MPELGPLGSVRGAFSNERPYRELTVREPLQEVHVWSGRDQAWAGSKKATFQTFAISAMMTFAQPGVRVERERVSPKLWLRPRRRAGMIPVSRRLITAP